MNRNLKKYYLDLLYRKITQTVFIKNFSLQSSSLAWGHSRALFHDEPEVLFELIAAHSPCKELSQEGVKQCRWDWDGVLWSLAARHSG